jgi:hypothetical protein
MTAKMMERATVSRLADTDVPEEIAEKIHVEPACHAGQENATGDPEGRDDADRCVAIEPRPLREFENAQGAQHDQRNRDVKGVDAKEQSQGHTPEGDVGEPSPIAAARGSRPESSIAE